MGSCSLRDMCGAIRAAALTAHLRSNEMLWCNVYFMPQFKALHGLTVCNQCPLCAKISLIYQCMIAEELTSLRIWNFWWQMEPHAEGMVPYKVPPSLVFMFSLSNYGPLVLHWWHHPPSNTQHQPFHCNGSRMLVFKCLLSILVKLWGDYPPFHRLLIRFPIVYSDNHV